MSTKNVTVNVAAKIQLSPTCCPRCHGLQFVGPVTGQVRCLNPECELAAVDAGTKQTSPKVA